LLYQLLRATLHLGLIRALRLHLHLRRLLHLILILVMGTLNYRTLSLTALTGETEMTRGVKGGTSNAKMDFTIAQWRTKREHNPCWFNSSIDNGRTEQSDCGSLP
jgi:hypothetical protein